MEEQNTKLSIYLTKENLFVRKNDQLQQ